jgi:iron(III) transport system ATP-binding protein
MTAPATASRPAETEAEGPAPTAAPAPESAPFLEIRDLTKRFGDFVALDRVSLTIDEGAFVCFLGPSGCGKTTLLRAIAGLDRQSEGRIFQRGRDISDLPPAERDFGIVFQSYALFPNLTAAQNVGYGLVNQRLGRKEVQARVADLLELVGLPDAGPKYPAALSGGQQQRVALARALAMRPGLLLLDEPLSALDAKVRVRLRGEMKNLQRRLGVTTIMVTHDQEEALALADVIVVMNHGLIEQVGDPLTIYRQPATPHAADFVGEMNFLCGSIAAISDDTAEVAVGALRLHVDRAALPEATTAPGAAVTLCIRPEDVMVRDAAAEPVNRFDCALEALEFLGSFCRAELRPHDCAHTRLVADFSINLMRRFDLTPGDTVMVALPARHLRVFPGHVHGIAADADEAGEPAS